MLALALAVGLTQLGEMAREVIDPDESSFILMGVDVAAGHLPFVHQFDLKPPVIVLLLGGLFALFGESLLATRLLGDGLVLVTAALVFLIARPLTGYAAALSGSLIWVVLASLDLGQPTYSELPTGDHPSRRMDRTVGRARGAVADQPVPAAHPCRPAAAGR